MSTFEFVLFFIAVMVFIPFDDCSFFGRCNCDRRKREYTDRERAEGLHLDDR